MPACTYAYTMHTTLISVAELARHLDDDAFAIFDCRHELSNPAFGSDAYAASHIPSARFAHVDHDLAAPLTGTNGRHPLPDPAIFGAWLGRMGVSNGKQVVAYDNAGGVYASRLWWMLRWLGHQGVAVLDGGWQAWLESKLPVTAEVPVPTQERFNIAVQHCFVDADYVLQHLHAQDMILLDARANDRYHGQNETIDPVGGHIPGAVNRFFKENLTPRGFFKAPTQLRADFAPLLGEASPKAIVSQCGSGVTACHNLLAMEVAGLRGGRLYPGSWSEWIADPSRPRAS
jgi:thiosulfate/3-mercaptopyruvate sulfurtransferase